MKTKQINKSVREELLNCIEDDIYTFVDTEVSDLHHNIFNTSFYVVGHYDAKQWLKIHDLDGLEVLNDVIEFEIDLFGEVGGTRIKELTSYEKLVNAYWYWIGQEILNESECLANNSDKQFLTKEMADKIVAELKE